MSPLSRDIIYGCFIAVLLALELQRLFNLYWLLVVPLGQNSSIDGLCEERAWQNR